MSTQKAGQLRGSLMLSEYFTKYRVTSELVPLLRIST
jgi:hypothetical protein